MDSIKKCLYDSYKWLYEEAVASMKKCLALAKNRKELGKMGWAADWLESANDAYKRARRYKRSMEFYAN